MLIKYRMSTVIDISVIPPNTSHSAGVVLMLVHRLRRWPSIKTTPAECFLFAVIEVKTVYIVLRLLYKQLMEAGEISANGTPVA